MGVTIAACEAIGPCKAHVSLLWKPPSPPALHPPLDPPLLSRRGGSQSHSTPYRVPSAASCPLAASLQIDSSKMLGCHMHVRMRQCQLGPYEALTHILCCFLRR
jgi:hypothetical protein